MPREKKQQGEKDVEEKRKVLIVDDVEINRDILAEILEEHFEVIEAENGQAALARIAENRDSLAVILLDLMMPVLDGFGVLAALKEEGSLDRIPVLVISGENSVESETRCLACGVADFIHKPFDETIVRRRVDNVTALYAYKARLEDKVAVQTKALLRQNKELKEQARKLAQYNDTIIDILGTVVESRNLESGDHIQRVKGYTRILAETMMREYPEYGLDQHAVDVMVPASALHDVGKIAIPDSILLKPGRLTPEEFAEMKLHTTRGCEIIASIVGAWDEEYKKVSYDICRYHHERYDGRGYPDGLVGEEIPVAAQVVSIADVYDALISKRVYKDAYTRDEAFRMIMEGECGTFSPKLLDCFAKARGAFEAFAAGREA